MSHQSGIRVDDELASSLASLRKKVRAMKLKIDGERCVLDATMPVTSDWEKDYDKCVTGLLDAHKPCYLFYRLDSVSELGHDWLFISWVPDNSSARDKMVYAATRITIRKQFGDSFIKEDITGSTMADVNLRGFKDYLVAKSAPAPMTAAELEKAALLNDKSSSGFFSPQQTVKAIVFELTNDAVSNVRKFASGSSDYLQFSIDLDKEMIASQLLIESLSPDLMVTYTPKNEGRYHLYRLNYTRDGKPQSAIFFIHSIAGYKSSVKSRMLYSTCKSSLVERLEQDFGLQCTRIEVDDMTEVNEKYLLDVLFPKSVEQKLRFEKPQGPAGRRPRTQPL